MTNEAFEEVRYGGCQCGAVRYELHGPVIKIFICHCNECRKQSASAFGISVFMAHDAVRVTRGVPKWWSRTTDSGRILDCAFCPDCGTRLWHQRAVSPQFVTVKAGSLDDRIDISSAVHIWTSRMLPGIVIPEGAITFALEPE